MPSSSIKAAELLKRYANGERDFRGANLRGQSFKGCDLSGADFSGADIRSTNFTRAILCGANFSGAKAGLQKWRAIRLVVVSWGLGVFSGPLGRLAGFQIADILNNSSGVVKWCTTLYLLALLDVMALRVTKLLIHLSKVLTLLSVVTKRTKISAVNIAIILALIVTFFIANEAAFTVFAAVIFVFTFALTFAIALEASFSTFAGVRPRVGAATSLFAFTVAGLALLGVFKSLVAVTMALVGARIAWLALQGDTNYGWIRQFAITFAAKESTTFCDADLSDATFAKAILRSANLERAKLSHANWHQVKGLGFARIGDTILSKPEVQKLLVTHRGAGKSYKECDFRELNLAGVNLCRVDLSNAVLNSAKLCRADLSNAVLNSTSLHRANLNQADLSNANLSDTNLAASQILGKSFRSALLTGACIDSWQIGKSTNLDNVQCDYIYRKYDEATQKFTHRQPDDPNSKFASGEFTKLSKVLESALETINLTFTESID